MRLFLNSGQERRSPFTEAVFPRLRGGGSVIALCVKERGHLKEGVPPPSFQDAVGRYRREEGMWSAGEWGGGGG